MASVIVEERCVVLLGKSGAGKSTVANMLVDHDPMSTEEPPFHVSPEVLQSVTREVSHVTTEFHRGRTLYRLKVIDTVGLFDTNAEGNDIILEKMEAYFKDYIQGVNLFLFVFKKNRFTKEEKEVFSFIRKKFDQEISPISAIAITACEADSSEIRERLIQEFRSNPDTREIATQMQLGIYPVGFPPLNQLALPLQEYYKDVMKKDYETLMDLIIRSKRVHLTKKLFVEKVKPVIRIVYVGKKLCNFL